METQGSGNLKGEFWGGLAAMLVALPSALAFGVAIFSPLGASYAAQGALAGVLGTVALGIVAPTFGGTNRLITTPSAPAAAVLTAFAVELIREGHSPNSALLMLTLLALLCGLLQVGFGAVRLGRLIKYMPYPVVSGFSSGVGLLIIISEGPIFLGVPKGKAFGAALLSPSLWNGKSLAVGAVTIAVMVLAPKVTRAVPAVILGLFGGSLVYFALGLSDHSLLTLAGNQLVVGPLGAGGGLLAAVSGRAKAIGTLGLSDFRFLLTPTLTLAVLLSIDTLKTSVVLDALTRTRHNSNRELIGQGLGNIVAALVGGVPGSGQTGATLVNLSSGGQKRLSGVLEGVLALVAFLLLGGLIAWIPLAALAGILIVVGFRMFDWDSLQLLRSRSTILDFVVILSVVVVAKAVSLIAASAVGIGLAILLFIREQSGGSVVRRKTYGNQTFSRRVRLPEEMAVLEQYGDRTVIFELQGSLFFGTADRLLSALEPELKTRTYVVLDMRRVLSVDVTAAHVLEQVEDTLAEHKAFLIFCHFALKVPSGRDIEQYFKKVGIVRPERSVQIFETRDDALLWIEERILGEEMPARAAETPLELRDIGLFAGRKEETLAALESCMEQRSYQAGERIFSRGDRGDELLLIRRGVVRIQFAVAGKIHYHVATFGRGDFLGEMAFFDRQTRSTDAIAVTETELFALPRDRFDALAREHKMIAIQLLEGVALTLALRMRRADRQLRALQEG
ncbi:MAG TPA: SulP family inorganic anion transporter [Candidatus Acidoferrales bacterium]|nr:SulP family inorganic anion transporter [Candidatus Acidoferrales bacterium]